EPTLKKDLKEIIELAQDMNFKEITIQTNGSPLQSEEKVAMLAPFRHNLKVNVSFHASDRELFGKLSQAPHTYDQTLKALENLGRHRIPTNITIVIQKDNYRLLKSHVQFIRENYPFITHFSFNFIDPIFNAWKNKWTIPTLTESENGINECFQYITDNDCTFRIEKMPLCYLDGFEHCQSNLRRHLFDEKRVCSFMRIDEDEKAEKFFQKPLWKTEEGKSEFFYPSQCKECSLLDICPGMNSNYVLVHGDKEARPVRDKDPGMILERAASGRREVESVSTVQALQEPMTSGSSRHLPFEKRIEEDLKVFRLAIDSKANKNSILDTYSMFLTERIGFQDEGSIMESWKKYAEGVRSGGIRKKIHFYMHMPYCKTNCTFCLYASTLMKGSQQVEDYVKFVIGEMEKFAPLFKGITFNSFYMGGGTPSILSPDQLERIFSRLFSLYEFNGKGERCMEFNPSSATLDRLEVLRKYGFNRLSMGIQSLSERVLRANRRVYQTQRMVRDAVQNFKKLKFNNVNVDLVLGLKGDTPFDFLRSFEEVCRMDPGNITVYPIKTTDKYIQDNYRDFEDFKNHHYPLFKEVTKRIKEVAQINGYASSDPAGYVKPMLFSKKLRTKDESHEEIEYPYVHFGKEQASIFGLGYYSHSRIENGIEYKYVDKANSSPVFLKSFSTSPDDFTYDADAISPLFEKVKHIVISYCTNRRVSRKEYADAFGSDIVLDFPYAIEALKEFGVIGVDPEEVAFADIDEKQLYPYFLFFVGRENAIKKIPFHALQKPRRRLAEAMLL
ncbi:MAG TPA: radical SAM protein, partial [Candidatus Nanoarchaeia archaeon]|nr:radical SAM protein [Candidatus Nanoarchaeia archaeon]